MRLSCLLTATAAAVTARSFVPAAAATAWASFDEPVFYVLNGVKVGLPVGVVEDHVDDGVDGPEHPAQDVDRDVPTGMKFPVRIWKMKISAVN